MMYDYLFYLVLFGILFLFIPYRMMHFFEKGKMQNPKVSKFYLWSARVLLIIILGFLYSFFYFLLLLLAIDRFNSEPSPYHPLLGVCIFSMIITALLFCASLLYRKALT